MPPKVTLRDVARLAGVSPATVSRVGRGNLSVDDNIRSRVRQAAAQLGVRLDGRHGSSLVLFLLANRPMLHPIHSRILVGAEGYCAAHGWDLVLQSYRYVLDEEPKRIRTPRILERRGLVRAVILAGTNSGNALEALRAMGVEVAVFGNNVVGKWEPSREDAVYSDEIGGAREMTQYLHSLGHRDIWYVGVAGRPWMLRSAEGYRQEMERAGLEPRIRWMHTEEREAGYLAAKSLFGKGEAVTAIFAGSDSAAEGVYRALRDLGLRVPEDVSVCGVNDSEGSILHPALTTIRPFPEEVGRNLAELVLDRIGNPDLPPRQRVIPTQVVRRDSCVRRG
ncbi:MAG: Ribose operon repressor [Bryobacteraceae bacterium]|nr:Ribose operon repressor [Bryobacteraceae bacterium]